MTDDEIDKPIDDDYIDVRKRRADVSTAAQDEEPPVERSPRAAQHPERAERPVGPSHQMPDMSDNLVDMSHVFDDGGGSGAASATDDMIDQNAVRNDDGRAPTRTFFYTVEAPAGKRDKFKRLYRHQEGVGDPDRRAQNRPADRRRTIDIFCGQLEMTTHQQERVQYVIEGLTMSHMAHYSSQQVILAVISLVANEDGRFIRDEAAYRDLLDSTDSDLRQIKKIRSLVRRKSDRL